MTEVEKFMARQPRFNCKPLRAVLTKEQCRANRSRSGGSAIFACIDCPGMGAEVVAVDLCKCGKPIFSKSSGQCRPCYDKAAHAKRKAAKAAELLPGEAVGGVSCAACGKLIDNTHWADECPFCMAHPVTGKVFKKKVSFTTVPIVKNPLIQPLASDKQIVLDLLHKHELWEWLQECQISAENIIELLEAARMPGLRLVV